MQSKIPKVVLTGGHAATTAISVIEEIIRRHGSQVNSDSWKLYWVGSKYAFVDNNIPTLEYEVMPARGVVFHHIVSGRVQKKFTRWTIPSLLKIPVGFFHAFTILLRIRPNIVLSFGGYSAFPVVVAAWFLRIPVVLHEQTVAVGRANKASLHFALKICLSRESSKKYLPKNNKTVITGNPVMSQIWEVLPKSVPEKLPVIFVMGGSRGSSFINNIVTDELSELLEKYYVIHQAGHHDFASVKKIKMNLPKLLKKRYEIYKVIDPMQIDGVYRRADVVVSRAGANTVSEVMASKRPSVLIPIPWSAFDEQTKNAQFAVDFGIAEIVEQNTFKVGKLTASVTHIIKNYSEIIRKTKNKVSPDKGACEKVVDVVEECLK